MEKGRGCCCIYCPTSDKYCRSLMKFQSINQVYKCRKMILWCSRLYKVINFVYSFAKPLFTVPLFTNSKYTSTISCFWLCQTAAMFRSKETLSTSAPFLSLVLQATPLSLSQACKVAVLTLLSWKGHVPKLWTTVLFYHTKHKQGAITVYCCRRKWLICFNSFNNLIILMVYLLKPKNWNKVNTTPEIINAGINLAWNLRNYVLLSIFLYLIGPG